MCRWRVHVSRCADQQTSERSARRHVHEHVIQQREAAMKAGLGSIEVCPASPPELRYHPIQCPGCAGDPGWGGSYVKQLDADEMEAAKSRPVKKHRPLPEIYSVPELAPQHIGSHSLDRKALPAPPHSTYRGHDTLLGRLSSPASHSSATTSSHPGSRRDSSPIPLGAPLPRQTRASSTPPDMEVDMHLPPSSIPMPGSTLPQVQRKPVPPLSMILPPSFKHCSPVSPLPDAEHSGEVSPVSNPSDRPKSLPPPPTPEKKAAQLGVDAQFLPGNKEKMTQYYDRVLSQIGQNNTADLWMYVAKR